MFDKYRSIELKEIKLTRKKSIQNLNIQVYLSFYTLIKCKIKVEIGKLWCMKKIPHTYHMFLSILSESVAEFKDCL